MNDYLAYLDEIQQQYDSMKNAELELGNVEELERLVGLNNRKRDGLKMLIVLLWIVGVILLLMKYVIASSVVGVVMFSLMIMRQETRNQNVEYKNAITMVKYNIREIIPVSIRNQIVDKGDSHLSQLLTWWMMYDLTHDDELKHGDALKIIGDICTDYGKIRG